MAFEANVLKREFKFDKDGTMVTLPDPNPEMSVEEVQRFYSHQYPELTTATFGKPKTDGGKMVYNIETTVGTKG